MALGLLAARIRLIAARPQLLNAKQYTLRRLSQCFGAKLDEYDQEEHA